jgi:hypothetical protein
MTLGTLILRAIQEGTKVLPVWVVASIFYLIQLPLVFVWSAGFTRLIKYIPPLEESNRKKRKKSGEKMKVPRLNWGEVEEAKKMLDQGSPVIVENIPKSFLDSVPMVTSIDDSAEGVHLGIQTNADGPLEQVAGKYYGTHTYGHTLRFAGDYDDGNMHIDFGFTSNCYLMQKGRKEFIVVPSEFSDNLPSIIGIDSISVVPETFKSGEWEKYVDRYYHDTLEEGQILLFHNSHCYHWFKNLSKGNVGVSARSLTTRVWDKTFLLSLSPMATYVNTQYAKIPDFVRKSSAI